MTDSMPTVELFALVRSEALHDDGDPDRYWALVSALRDRDPHEVWALLFPLSTHEDVRLQQLVPDVLRGLGREAQPLAKETLELFAQMLAANPPADVVACIANACADFHHGSVVTMLTPYAGHERVEVREGVLHAVRRSSHPEAIAALLDLSLDPVDELREWATFALGSQRPLVDGPEVREALAARLVDRHEPTRDEALVGLGLRRDARALGPLLTQFERGFVGVALFEAARMMASPKLTEALEALRQRPSLTDEEREELDAAVTACRG
ncbi:MAG: HEAT repeat domain-containing protein [Myxococcales bacterium]|nr:HEAT repeat domain-containing protein [Myxococcales bacterium]